MACTLKDGGGGGDDDDDDDDKQLYLVDTDN
jgi:hypothetical protein